MTHTSHPSAQPIEQAISAFVAQQGDTSITFQLPGMEASQIQQGPSSTTISTLEELSPEGDLQALKDSWEQTLVSVRNGELSHLVIDLPGGQAASLKIVPTNQDS